MTNLFETFLICGPVCLNCGRHFYCAFYEEIIRKSNIVISTIAVLQYQTEQGTRNHIIINWFRD